MRYRFMAIAAGALSMSLVAISAPALADGRLAGGLANLRSANPIATKVGYYGRGRYYGGRRYYGRRGYRRGYRYRGRGRYYGHRYRPYYYGRYGYYRPYNRYKRHQYYY